MRLFQRLRHTWRKSKRQQSPEFLIEDSGLRDLDQRLTAWASLWGEHAGPITCEQHQILNARLRESTERIFGAVTFRQVEGCSETPGSPLLPRLEPLFTAFVGRRAARELTRRMFFQI